jgi:predicted Zn-dependent peptidase
MEDSSSQANWYARTAVLFSKIETPEDVLKKFDAVTQDEIKKVAAQIFDWDKVRIAIIGNIKKENVLF